MNNLSYVMYNLSYFTISFAFIYIVIIFLFDNTNNKVVKVIKYFCLFMSLILILFILYKRIFLSIAVIILAVVYQLYFADNRKQKQISKLIIIATIAISIPRVVEIHNAINHMDEIVDDTYYGYQELDEKYIQTNTTPQEYIDEQKEILQSSDVLDEEVINTDYTIEEYVNNIKDSLINDSEIIRDMYSDQYNFKQIEEVLQYLENIMDIYITLSYINESNNLVEMEEVYRNYLMLEDELLYPKNQYVLNHVSMKAYISITKPENVLYTYLMEREANWCTSDDYCTGVFIPYGEIRFYGTTQYQYFSPRLTSKYNYYSTMFNYVRTYNTEMRVNHYAYITIYELLNDEIIQSVKSDNYKENDELMDMEMNEVLNTDEYEEGYRFYNYEEMITDKIYAKLGIYECYETKDGNLNNQYYMYDEYQQYCKYGKL